MPGRVMITARNGAPLIVWQSAVANSRRFRIGFSFERHVAAVTASIDFHARFSPQRGDGTCSLSGLIVRNGSVSLF